MIVDLKPEQQSIINLAVSSGAYNNAADVLDQALEIVREQLETQSWMLRQRDAIAIHLEKSFGQAESGELTDGDLALDRLRERRARLLNP